MRLTRTETTERDTGEDNDRQGTPRAGQNQKQGGTAVALTHFDILHHKPSIHPLFLSAWMMNCIQNMLSLKYLINDSESIYLIIAAFN